MNRGKWSGKSPLLNSIFNFSRGEAYGFILLLFLVALYLVFPLLFRYFSSGGQEDEATCVSVDAWLHSVDVHQESVMNQSRKVQTMDAKPFDPNTAGYTDMKEAGVPEFICRRIVNYRNKGGIFRQKKDFLKLYGVDEALYNKLAHLLMLPDTLITTAKQKTKPKVVQLAFDINKANATELIAIKGIGPVLSGRIIKFRDKLGGFVREEQLKEVYGLDTLTLERLQQASFISSSFEPVKIAINTAKEEALAVHPYIGRYRAEKILRKRKEKGGLPEEQSLRAIKIFKEEELERIMPYIDFQTSAENSIE